ncbi:MAG TPA: PAS domain S-box protein [Anaerolineae bacterium]|nr:PAS domain S-box protein [Anaerolineae bacterium]
MDSTEFTQLRRQAEEILNQERINFQQETIQDLQKLVHELRVHQIELELQNEELRQAHYDLEASRDRYSSLFDFAPVGYFTIDQQGIILEANLTTTTLLGYERRALINQPFTRFIASKDQDAYYLFQRALFSHRTPHTCELNFVKKNGSIFDGRLEALITQDHRDELPHCLLVLIDITERRQMQRRLQCERDFAETLIETAEAIILVLDPQGQIVRFNRYMEEISGYTLTEVWGKDWFDTFIPARDRQRMRAIFLKAISDHKTQGAISVIVTKDRHEREIAWYDKTLKNANGTIIGLLVIGQDVTEQNRAESERANLFEEVSRQREQLRAITRRLADAQEADRKAFARELHDRVGQSLTALDLNLNIIQSELRHSTVQVSELTRTRLEDSLALVAQTAEHIRDVMANLRPPVLDDYGLVAAVRWYANEFSSRVDFRVVVQSEQLEPRLPAPVEDSLFRIVQEALTNVAKHAAADLVSITISTDDDHIRLVITDNGRGFELHQWSDPAQRQSWGIVTMTERAEAIGGRMTVKSTLGQGTQVIVEVPRSE